MSIISLVAAVDEKYGLGKNGQLLCHLPADLKHFKQITIGKPIIMGRKTFESIGRPLPERQNIVLSRKQHAIEGVQVVNSLEEALNHTDAAPEVMMIGGATLFAQILPFATRVYLTIIHHQFDADTFFPEPLDLNRWRRKKIGYHPQDEQNPYAMTFYYYFKN